MATSYEKGTKLQKRYQVTKTVRSYEKDTKLRKRYEVTKKVRNYEKGTKLGKRYEVTKKGTKMLRNKNISCNVVTSCLL